MKHLNTILFILFAALFLPGCSGYDIDSLFDKPAEARVQDSLSAVKKELTEAADGWIATYKIGESAITLYLHIRFNPDNTLSLQIPNKDGSADVQEGSYTLSYTQQFNLIFDTKSFFSDFTKINLGNFVFELIKEENGQYLFNGLNPETKAQACTLILRKAAKDEKAEFATMATEGYEYIKLTTANNEGEWVFAVGGKGVWADFNNNGRFDDGEEMNGFFLQSIQSQTLEIYGNTITSLSCSNNNLTSIDISHCPHLESLQCAYNQLTSINVTKNPNLSILICIDNQLTSLDVTKNPKLELLLCEVNQLSNLDVTKNPNLSILWCGLNQLTSLNFAQNTKLEALVCDDNQLISLDITNNPYLKTCMCSINQLTELNVTQNKELQIIRCGENKLTSLDITNNPRLRSLQCDNNQLTSLDITKNPNLELLNCNNNQLTNLDITKNPKLVSLFFFCNRIKGQDMTDLVNSLPSVRFGDFCPIDTKSSREGNICTREQVNQAKSKGWKVRDWNGSKYGEFAIDYEGS